MRWMRVFQPRMRCHKYIHYSCCLLPNILSIVLVAMQYIITILALFWYCYHYDSQTLSIISPLIRNPQLREQVRSTPLIFLYYGFTVTDGWVREEGVWVGGRLFELLMVMLLYFSATDIRTATTLVQQGSSLWGHFIIQLPWHHFPCVARKVWWLQLRR